MNWRTVSHFSGRVPFETLRRYADEWLGSERSFDELEPKEQEALLLDIEADIEEDMQNHRLINIHEEPPQQDKHSN